MKKTLLTIIIAFIATFAAQAQAGKMAAIKGKVNNGYDFWLYAPQSYFERPDSKCPVIIYLHGAALCGHGLRAHKKYLTIDAIDKGREIETMVIAPQNPGGGWKPEKLNNVLEWVMEHYRVDPDRIYVVGMSLGGYGAMDFVGTYPHKIAAAMALCGGCTLKDVQGLGKLPFWIFHGTADRAVGIAKSKSVVRELQEQHNDSLLRYTWLHGANHGRLARIFYLDQTYQWLLSHNKSDNPQQVNRDVTIDLNTMKNAYNGLSTRGSRITTVKSLENIPTTKKQDNNGDEKSSLEANY